MGRGRSFSRGRHPVQQFKAGFVDAGMTANDHMSRKDFFPVGGSANNLVVGQIADFFMGTVGGGIALDRLIGEMQGGQGDREGHPT